MSDFAADLARFAEQAALRANDVFVGTTVEVQRSVVEGSTLTGAPGQPVDTGFLKDSFVGRFTSKTTWELTTNVAYAPVIEANTKAAYDDRGVPRPKGLPPQGGGSKHIKSTVGGPHSIAQTVAGFQRIVDAVNAEHPHD